MSRARRPRRRGSALLATFVGVALSGGPSAVSAQPAPAPGNIDRFTLENGIRVVLVRTERAGPVAVSVAVRDASITSQPDDLAALALTDAGPWGELSARERAVLFTARNVQSRGLATGLATVRTLQAPAEELPLLLHLAGHALREPAWDEATLAAAMAQRSPEEGPRAFVLARERLFPRGASAPGEAAQTPLERLRGLERARLQRETVISVVGDFDADRAAELVHQHLDAAPRRAAVSPPAPPARLANAAPIHPPARAFATTLAVRIDGDPARRHALRVAFDVFARGRLRALRESSGILMVNELDEPTAGARLVGLRLVAADARTLASLGATATAELTKLIATGPTQAELTAAAARLATIDEIASSSAVRRASDGALSELAGERAGALPALTPARVLPLLAEAFGEGRLLTLSEHPSP